MVDKVVLDHLKVLCSVYSENVVSKQVKLDTRNVNEITCIENW